MDTYFKARNSSLGYLASAIVRLLGKRMGNRFQEAGLEISMEQWAVLVMLWDSDGLTQQDLAHGLVLEKSSVSRALDGLERHGWVSRARDPNDARLKRIMLTDKAWSISDQSVGIVKSVLGDAQKDLSPDEQAMLHRLLLRVLQTLLSQ